MRRRGARRARVEKLRDRDAPLPAAFAPAAPGALHRYNYGANALGAVAPRDGKSAVRFQWAGGAARAIALVASFDGFMHHRMHRISVGHRAGPTTFEVTLRIAPGTYNYKFLVDGVWCTDKHAPHPIEASPDGLLHHKLVVDAPPPPLDDVAAPHQYAQQQQQQQQHRQAQAGQKAARAAHMSPEADSNALSNALDLADARHGPRGGRYSVVRSSSVSELHSGAGSTSATNLRNHALGAEQHSSHSFASLNSSATRGMGSAGDRLDRPSSFMVSATMSEQSPGSGHRKSLLHRVGSGWMRRFSGRHHSNVNEEFVKAREREAMAAGGGAPLTSKNSYSSSGAVKIGASAPHDRSGVFPSGSEMSSADKENGGTFSGGRQNRGMGTPERTVLRRNNGIRGSGRATAVKISGPTMVDVPKSVDEVNRQADNWRQMARHLQESLSDPSGARELLGKAIKHREKHGLWCTVENAQTHVDLARNLSKADRMGDAEFHLRIALRIYKQVEAGPEHIGDLLHYIGVVVDRQKKRAEAEELYRSALDTYKKNRLTGNNVEIALKNLSLNLRKQNRADEAQKYVEAYYGYVKV